MYVIDLFLITLLLLWRNPLCVIVCFFTILIISTIYMWGTIWYNMYMGSYHHHAPSILCGNGIFTMIPG